MRTLYSWLSESDLNSIADSYCYQYPPDYELIPNKTLSLEEIQSRLKTYILQFMKSLLELKPVTSTDDDAYLFFAIEDCKGDRAQVTTLLCKQSKIIEQEDPELTDWSMTDWEEVLGYYIADTSLTIDFIDTVLAQILFEMCAFGTDRQQSDQKKKELIEQLLEAEKHTGGAIPAEEVFASLREKYGFPEVPKDPVADGILHEICERERFHAQHCKKREVARIKELLCSDRGLSIN